MESENRELEEIRLAREGDQAAFESLILRYRGIVLALAERILDDFHEAEDLAQEVFLTAFRKLEGLNDESSFGPWLKRITFTKCLRYAENLRKKHEEPHAGDSGIFDPFLAELEQPADEWEQYASSIEQAVNNLSDSQCHLLDLFYIKGLTHKQIASFLQIPEGTVKRRLFDTRKSLQDKTGIPDDASVSGEGAAEYIKAFRKGLENKLNGDNTKN